MGGGNSTVANQAGDEIFDNITALGREISCNIDNEFQEIVADPKLNNERNKVAYEKARKKITDFKVAFSEYQRLIEEARTHSSQLQCALDEHKLKIEKLNKEKKELTVTSSQNLNHQKALREEWKQKCESREKKLNIETDRKQTAEDELLQMIVYKAKCEAYEKRLETIKRDLKEAEDKLDASRKSKIEKQFKGAK